MEHRLFEANQGHTYAFCRTTWAINPYGAIPNSNARSRGGSAGVSVIGDTGLLGAAINSLKNNYGILPNGTGSAHVRVQMNQTKYDFKGQLNNPFALAQEIRLKFGYTDYKHVELDNGQAASTFLNKTYEGRLELEHQTLGIVKGVMGFQPSNSDFSALGACLPVLQSTQANAIFRGFKTKTVFPLMQNHYGAVDLTLFGDYTRGTFQQGGNVPSRPPLCYGLEISFQKKTGQPKHV